MPREDVEKLLIAGGEDKHFRAKYDVLHLHRRRTGHRTQRVRRCF